MDCTTYREIPNSQFLQERLATLKRNREQVPLDLLKTKYKKGYDKLCAELKELTSEYIRNVTLRDLCFRNELYPEALDIIEQAITGSGLLRECSRAVFKRQDFGELERHAEKLREVILTALQPFYERHTCLYILPECLEEPYPPPYIYNDATGCFYINDQWIKKPDMPDGFLMFLQEKESAQEKKGA